jgi:hypothetical protein
MKEYRFRPFRRALLMLSVAGVLAGAVAAASASPARASGNPSWQITFAGTATFPSSGSGFGFHGRCQLSGGLTSGTSGDCEGAQYVRAPAGEGFTCQLGLHLTAWSIGGSGNFLYSGTGDVHPTSLTAPCVAFFPGSTPFTAVDSGFPAAPGHYNLGSIGGVVGEFHLTVTEIP